MSKVLMECHCGSIYEARSADIKRGWGLSCSKHCAAVRRDFGRKAAKRIDGKKIKQVRKSPSTYRPNDNRVNDRDEFDIYENWGHPHASGYEGHGQE